MPRELPGFDRAMRLRAEPYERMAQYYETDQMGIIHHAAYVHWIEEARVSVMEQLGFGYERMEGMGIYCPVLAVKTEYKKPVRFHERVRVECRAAEYTGMKLTLLYEITRLTDGALCTAAETRHGFLDGEGNILSLKRSYPEIHALLLEGMLPPPEA